ncbi:NEAT domain-containing protein [Paenibacillus sp. GCM10027627]|uniref:NEAT domain-containing protein n=1 Tax=unclassified Paenibacillus TaxID=185978 RepID=UPI00363B369D
MKTGFKRIVMVWLSLCLTLTLLQIGPIVSAASGSANSSIPNGVYEVDFNIMEDGKTSVSTANTYMKIPGTKGKLTVNNGVIWFEHEIETENLGKFKYLAYRPDGVPKGVIVNSVVQDKTGYIDAAMTDGAASQRKVLKYGISDIAKPQDIMMHIDITQISYNHWYHAQIKIDTSQFNLPGGGTEGPGEGGPGTGPVTLEQLNGLIASAKTVYAASVEGTGFGQFPAGSKQQLDTAIFNAEVRLSLAAPGDTAAYGSIHQELNQQLTAFKARQIVANKTALQALVPTMKAFVNAATVRGQANGSPGSVTAAVVAGEYEHTYINTLKEKLLIADVQLTDPSVTQTAADNMVTNLRDYYETSLQNRYVANEPLQIYVLDTAGDTAVESPFASEIDRTATTLTHTKDYSTFGEMRANLKLNVTPDENKVYWFGAWGDGTYISPDMYEQYNMLSAVTVTPNRAVSADVYQGVIKASDPNKDTQWTGLGHITFKLGGTKRSLYVSFNRLIHEKLQQLVQLAERNHQSAPKLESADQAAYDNAKANLSAAIQTADPVSKNLNATRQAILNAEAGLKTALDAFKAVAQFEYDVYFSTLHANQAAFSVADSYLFKPAKVSPLADGTKAVTFTVTDSSSIKSLQAERGGVYHEAETVSENAAANSRVVKIIVSDLASLIPAKVKVSTPRQGGVYEQTYDIRFNFNGVDNRALQAAIGGASAKLRTAVTGTGLGQYSDSAKAALSAAIVEAGKPAANGPNSEAQTAAALTALQTAVRTFEASAVTANQLPDGEYTIGFSLLKSDRDEASFVNGFVHSPARLTISGGTKKIAFTLKQSAEIPSFKVNGQNVVVQSTNVSENTRVVYFSISDLTVNPTGWAKFNWAAQNNYNEYDLRFKLDLPSIAPYVAPNPGGPGTGPNPNPGALQDGYYFISYRILKNGTDSTSIANEYVFSPALLKVEGASKTISFTVKRSFEINNITMNGSSGSIVSQNPAKNTRVVSYSIPNLTDKHSGTVRVDWAEVNYHHSYDIQFQFYENSIAPAGANPSVPGSESDGNVSGPGLENPGQQPGKEGEGEEEEGSGEENGTGNEVSFNDTKGHWAFPSISKAVELGIVNGFADGSFRPEQKVTRGEFASLISRALKLDGETGEISFQDSDQIPDWASKHAALAAKAGLIGGYEDGSFKAGKQMTRAELAVIIARASGIKLDDQTKLDFTDGSDIPVWARKEIAAAAAAGLVEGNASNQFEPHAIATRAQALTLIIRLLEWKEKAQLEKEAASAEGNKAEQAKKVE